jgi:HK97 family phage portal protein
MNDSPLYDLIHYQPNADMTAQSFWEAYVASIMLRGYAVAWKRYLGGTLSSIEYMHPDRTSWTRNPTTGAKSYTYRNNGKTVQLTEDDVFFTLGFSLDGCTPLSPIRMGASIFGAAISADVAANRTFRNGLMSTIMFKMEQVLKGSQRKEFKDNFKRELAGAMNAGKPVLLEGGMEAAALGINPKDAQLLESRSWSIEEVCRWFGVPPPLAGHSTKTTSWPTGNEAQMMMWLNLGLRALLVKLEQSMRKDLVPAKDKGKIYCEYNLDGLLRADSTSRAAYLVSMSNNGLMTKDEAREYDNRAPMGGNAAKLLVQGAMIPLDEINPEETASVNDAVDKFRKLLRIEAPNDV